MCPWYENQIQSFCVLKSGPFLCCYSLCRLLPVHQGLVTCRNLTVTGPLSDLSVSIPSSSPGCLSLAFEVPWGPGCVHPKDRQRKFTEEWQQLFPGVIYRNVHQDGWTIILLQYYFISIFLSSNLFVS